MPPFQNVLTSEAELRAIVGFPAERPLLKERRTIDGHFRAFIAKSPFILIATSGADGTCDVSPKGDAPGFVHVLDDTHLAIPDRNGNKRLDGLKNIVSNAHVGLLFVVPGRDETLRVNGRAYITRDPGLLATMPAQGVLPRLAIGAEVEQAQFHCVNSFRRSHSWPQESRHAADALAPF